MKHEFEQTSLWQSSLGSRLDDPRATYRDRLRVAFFSLRKKVEQLAGRRSAQLPDLTRHDIAHLDALWEIGSLIAGPSYEINPLEGFVLRGAFLLHDSALCFEAYEGGIAAVRNTAERQDSFAGESAKPESRTDQDPKVAADFYALRLLHASQAERLIDRAWSHPTTKEPIYLIDDVTLRTHVGQLIGRIAASHHWSIEEVASRLQQQVTALPGLPSDWRVDPVKLACLLRCADVFHIDSSGHPISFMPSFAEKGFHSLTGRLRITWPVSTWMSPIRRTAHCSLLRLDPFPRTVLNHGGLHMTQSALPTKSSALPTRCSMRVGYPARLHLQPHMCEE